METEALQTSAAAEAQQPTQRFTSAGLIVPTLGTTWPGQGGIYIGELPAAADRPGVHMVVSAEEADGLEYGGYGTKVPGADSRHNGRTNTAALLATGNSHPAAAWCEAYTADSHADFHLPSQLELNIASALAPQVFDQAPLHLTSTQTSASDAFVQDFEYGTSNWYGKDDKFRVRAVRWIPL